MRSPRFRRVRLAILRAVAFLLVASVPRASSAQLEANVPPSPKSAGAAIAISVGSTAGLVALAATSPRGPLPVVLAVAAVLGGPSTGYWYAGSPRWKKGMIVRGITAGVVGAGLGAAASCGLMGPERPQCNVGGFIAIGGAVTMVVTDILDVVDLPGAVREANGVASRVTLQPARGGIAINVSF